MIFRHIALKNFNFVFLANPPYQLPNPFGYQPSLALFAHTDKVVLTIIAEQSYDSFFCSVAYVRKLVCKSIKLNRAA
jgi:hypothetical protein